MSGALSKAALKVRWKAIGIGRRPDLPFDRDATSRLVPFVIAVMVYLAALALGGSMLLSSAISSWSASVKGTITVQILPRADGRTASDADIEKAVAVLQQTPGVGRIRVLDEAEGRRLVEPWLGRLGRTADIPVPRIIDVSLAPGARVDVAALTERLTQAVPNAEASDHRRWLGRFVDLSRSVQSIAVLVILVTALAASLVVIFAARVGLAIHQRVIEVLHLIGARDAYIAEQFQTHMLLQSLKGSLAGLAAAVLTLAIAGMMIGDLELFGLERASLGIGHWLALLALVPATAILAMVTARVTIIRMLGQVD